MENQNSNPENKSVDNFKSDAVSGENVVGGRTYTIIKPTQVDSFDMPVIDEIRLGDEKGNNAGGFDTGNSSAFSTNANEV